VTLYPVFIEDKCYIKSQWHFVRDPMETSDCRSRQGTHQIELTEAIVSRHGTSWRTTLPDHHTPNYTANATWV